MSIVFQPLEPDSGPQSPEGSGPDRSPEPLPGEPSNQLPAPGPLPGVTNQLQLLLELFALARLSSELHELGRSLIPFGSIGGSLFTPDAALDMPSLVAARLVGGETIPGLLRTVGNHIIEVGYAVDRVRYLFKDADEDDRARWITRAPSLLPPEV